MNTPLSDSFDNDAVRHVDATRARIGSRLDELGQRLSPGQLVDQAFDYVKDHGDGMIKRATDSMQSNPLPLLTIGVGLLWLLQSSSAGTSRDRGLDPSRVDDGQYLGGESWIDSARARADGVREKVASVRSDVASSVSERAGALRDAVRPDPDGSRLQRAEHAVGERAANLKGQVSQLSQRASRQTARATSELSRLMEEQPLVVGAIGIAIGSTIASLIPVTRAENQVLGGLSESLSQAGRQAAADGYQVVREEARQVVDNIATRISEGPASDGGAGNGHEPV